MPTFFFSWMVFFFFIKFRTDKLRTKHERINRICGIYWTQSFLIILIMLHKFFSAIYKDLSFSNDGSKLLKVTVVRQAILNMLWCFFLQISSNLGEAFPSILQHGCFPSQKSCTFQTSLHVCYFHLGERHGEADSSNL